MQKEPFLLLALSLFLVGCATPPKKTAFDNNRVFSKSKDAIWTELLSFFTTNNIQIKTIEKESGIIYAEPSRVDKSFADCGEEALALEVSRSATFNVFVRPTSTGTQVSVNSDFKIVRSFDRSTWTSECYSTGALEALIFAHLAG